MPFLVWDASALAKRFTLELGSETVDALFSASLHVEMATTVWGYAETFSILIRRRNGGRIGREVFEEAISALDATISHRMDR